MFIVHLLAVGLPGKLDETVRSLGAYDLNLLDDKEQGCKIKLEGNHSQLLSKMVGSLICRACRNGYIYIISTAYSDKLEGI